MLLVANTLNIAADIAAMAEALRLLVFNGVIAVPIMAVMVLLASRSATMGAHVIGVRLRWMGWIATAVMAVMVVAMLVTL